jgi:hypothetical protein
LVAILYIFLVFIFIVATSTIEILFLHYIFQGPLSLPWPKGINDIKKVSFSKHNQGLRQVVEDGCVGLKAYKNKSNPSMAWYGM